MLLLCTITVYCITTACLYTAARNECTKTAETIELCQLHPYV